MYVVSKLKALRPIITANNTPRFLLFLLRQLLPPPPPNVIGLAKVTLRKAVFSVDGWGDDWSDLQAS
jgi:hypothetical protein